MINKLISLINQCLAKNIPFVSYSLPESDQIYTWIQRSGKMVFVEDIGEVIDKTGFVYAPFHRYTNFPVVFFEPEIIFRNGNIDDSVIQEITDSDPTYPEYGIESPVEVNKEEYLEQVKLMIRSFDENLTKTVLSRVKLGRKPRSFNAGAFFLKLQGSYPDAFCHLINIPGAGCWVGASPETLFRTDGTMVRTVALAGTQKFKGEKDVFWGEKETEEQEMVTKHIESVMDQCGITDYIKGKPQTIIAGNVLHLLTLFRFNRGLLKNNTADFIHRLHPTPAVCGLPKETALDKIRQTEKHNREYYAGFCGPLSFKGNTDLFVNLRCMKILSNKLALFAGGGLTLKSIPLDEWNETELKVNSLLSVI